MPEQTVKCSCGNNFFIEHENATIIVDNKSNAVLSTESLNGYKILECIFCRRRFIGRQYQKGVMEEIIPIENFRSEDINKFKARNDIRGKEKFSSDILQYMIRKT